MAALKVFGVNFDGRNRRIVAAPSQAAAARLTGVSPHSFRQYGGETGNAEEIAVALQEPGVVWSRGFAMGGEWRRVGPAPPRHVFVFGSNERGIHGAGAAKEACAKHGARWGQGYGHHGDSFAIPTKDERIETLPLGRIEKYVQDFLAYATGHHDLTFQVTRIGCGLAGYKDSDIAPLFKGAPLNCQFDEKWHAYLGDSYSYWGTN